MDKLNTIFNIIYKEKIMLEEFDFNNSGVKGIYYKESNLPTIIGIDKSIANNRILYKSVLSEELGHHFTSSGNLTKESNCYCDELFKVKKENLAKKWAANFLISDEEFINALNKCISTRFEMSDYFDVTDEILQYKISSIVNDEIKYKSIIKDFKNKEVQYNACNV